VVAKMAIRVEIVLETIARTLPQTGGGILDPQLLDDLWHDRRLRAGLPFGWVIGKSRVCRFPVSGRLSTLKVCGRRTPEGKSYCTRCRKLAYYKPMEN
jgi:hypothetical protein